MSTLTISSNAKLNGSAVAARFTAITLITDPDPTLNQYPSNVSGDPSLKAAVTFDWEWQHMRQEVAGSLAGISAVFVARPPTRTLSGSYDAVVNQGAELCLFEWVEKNRRTGASENRSMSGYFRVTQTTLRGVTAQMSISIYPVDRLRFVGSADYLEPQSGSIGAM